MHVFEVWAGQQLSIFDYLKVDVVRLEHLAKHESYSSLVRLAGNAFHSASSGHWVVAVLLMPRFASFGKVVPSE